MNSTLQNMHPLQEQDQIDLKREVKRYLRYWPWFLLASIISIAGAFSYLRYTTSIYNTSAKIKILDESEGLELPTSAFIFKRSNINLENEIEILTSYVILEQVVRELVLTTNFYEQGTLQTSQLTSLPFKFEQTVNADNIFKNGLFEIYVTDKGFEIFDTVKETLLEVASHDTYSIKHELPFEIKIENTSNLASITDKKFLIGFIPTKKAVLALKSKIEVEAIGELSDLLKLNIKGDNKLRSELILNTLIETFNKDGIKDRQLISKNTLDFIDERFIFLAKELDSIEIDRKDFKLNNNLVDLATDAQLGLEQRTKSDEEVFRIDSQLSLANLLNDALNNNSKFTLLPANIGLENSSVNNLIEDYNSIILEREKLIVSAGINNPTAKVLTAKIDDLRSNIDRSLGGYIKQLTSSQNQLQSRNLRFRGEVSRLPEKEKLLRAIERQQKIKESLYLLLLQKREEAAINFAITEPSVKIVEYALSGTEPISPKSNIIYAGAFLGGLLVPFIILYLFFMLDTRLHTKEDVTFTNIPVVGEIPTIKDKSTSIFSDPNDRSILSESFRILSSNVNYLLPVKKEAKVIYCTSTIKGEGKTYVSMNLSLALSSLNKKVLLIGADLRNPQIHTHLNVDKHQDGLTNYLYDDSADWKDFIINGFEKHANHDTIISGPIPPNPAHLLTNGRFKQLLEEAKQVYDYVIVDTAPTILVTDTMLISQLADATIYLVRSNFTEKNLLNFSKELKESGKLKNMSYVINSVGASKSYGYSYNYGYGYGYGAKS